MSYIAKESSKYNPHKEIKIHTSILSAFFIFLLLPSAILWLFNFPYAAIASLLYFFSTIYIINAGNRVNSYHLLLLIYSLLICSFLFVQGYIFLSAYTFMGFSGIIYAVSLDLRKIINLFRHIYLFTVLILFSFIGMVWVAIDLGTLGSFENPNGDLQFFVPITFYGIEEFFIRPSSIYFEPGYFGFFIISYLFCRLLLGVNTSFDKYIAIGGLITQSFTYIACFALYFFLFIFLRSSKSESLKTLFFLMPFTIIILFSQSFEWVFSRAFGWYEDPESAIRVVQFFQMIDFFRDPYNVLFGLSSCNSYAKECPLIVGNLFSPLLYGGISVYLPVILLFLSLLISSFAKRNMVALISLLALTILMNSKPIYLMFPYSITVGLFLACIIYNLREKK